MVLAISTKSAGHMRLFFEMLYLKIHFSSCLITIPYTTIRHSVTRIARTNHDATASMTLQSHRYARSYSVARTANTHRARDWSIIPGRDASLATATRARAWSVPMTERMSRASSKSTGWKILCADTPTAAHAAKNLNTLSFCIKGDADAEVLRTDPGRMQFISSQSSTPEHSQRCKLPSISLAFEPPSGRSHVVMADTHAAACAAATIRSDPFAGGEPATCRATGAGMSNDDSAGTTGTITGACTCLGGGIDDTDASSCADDDEASPEGVRFSIRDSSFALSAP